jgi:hypothetical protein
MVGQSGQRPARQRDPPGVGASTGDRDHLTAVGVGDPAGSPAPVLSVQRGHPALVEVVDDAAHVMLVGHPHRHVCGTELPTLEASRIAARARVAKCLAC